MTDQQTSNSPENPLVSVLLPVYNGEEFVARTITSILNQSFRDFEFIIINDGSTDNTSNILDQLHDSRLRITHKTNEGLGRTLNLGLQMARGKYIARIDADDMADPKRLEKQLAFLEAHPEIAAVGSATKVIYPDGTAQIRLRPLEPHNIRQHIIKLCPLAHPSVLMRKDAALTVGGYDTAQDASLGRSAGEDYHLWVRMLASGFELANLPEPLITLNKAGTSITGSKTLGFRLLQRVKMRLWAKRTLGLGWKAYSEIMLVIILTLINQCGFKVDRIFNSITRHGRYWKDDDNQ
jgi:glycosyltransferase involved in cell wall biosynthesis